MDFDNDYKTMDTDFMESVWWVFKQLWDADRVYKSYRIMPYSWKLTTPLSNFEANANYKDVQDPAITVRFKLNALSSEARDALKDVPNVSELLESGKLFAPLPQAVYFPFQMNY